MFVAIQIPEELKERISRIQQELPGGRMKLVEGNALHITLKFLGNVDEEDLEEVKSRLGSVQFKKFQIPVKSAGVFPNEKYVRVIWIDCECEELIRLAKQVETAIAGMFKHEQFTPHITIAKVREKIEILPFLDKHKNDNLGKFECDSFYLYRSDLKPKGPVYTPMGKFKAVY